MKRSDIAPATAGTEGWARRRPANRPPAYRSAAVSQTSRSKVRLGETPASHQRPAPNQISKSVGFRWGTIPITCHLTPDFRHPAQRRRGVRPATAGQQKAQRLVAFPETYHWVKA